MDNHCNKHSEKPLPRGMIGPRITDVSRLLRMRFNRAAQEEGLFAGQQHIIIMLEQNGGLTVSQISKGLSVSTATASVSIKRLEKAGFVKKVQDEKDARITKIYLTDKGKVVPCRIKQKMDAQESNITAGLNDDEICKLSDMLDHIMINLEKEEMPND